MIDREKLEQARAWARATTGVSMKEVYAAEEVIQSLPDGWVGADTLRKLVEDWRTDCPAGDGPKILDDLESLLPAPPSPLTLADMSEEEALECQWAQADVEILGETKRVVLTHLSPSLRSARTLDQKGVQGVYEFYQITPLLNLPRMKWPEETHFDDLPEDIQEAVKAGVEDYEAGRFVEFDLDDNSEVKEGYLSTGWKPDKKSTYKDNIGTRWDFGADVGNFENGWKCEDGCCSCLDSLPEPGEPYYPVRKGEQ